jgi:hypothetical protein
MPYFELLAKRVQEVPASHGSLPGYVMRRRSASEDQLSIFKWRL